MARTILILTLVAALGFGAGRLTSPATSADPRPVQAAVAAAQGASVATREAAAAPTLESTRTQREALRANVATNDMDALIALADDAQQLASPAQRHAAIKSIVERMTELDPAAALDYAHQLSDGFARRTALITVISSVAQSDAQLAITMIGGIANPAMKQTLYHTAIRALALEDPIRALEISASLPGHPSNWTNTIYSQWARYDPQGALAHSATLTDPMGRRAALWSALNTWMQSDENAAAGWFEAAYATLGTEDREQMMSMFSQSSPQTMERLAALAPPQMRRRMQIGRMLSLVQRDPVMAAREFEQMTPGKRRDISASFIASEWAKLDRQAALEWAQKLSAEDRINAETGIFSQWIKEDSDAALAHLETLDNSQRKQMSRIVVEALAQKDPAEAFAWVRDQPDTNVDRNAIVNLAHRWSESDPNAAVAAFAKLQDKPWSQQPLQWTLHALAEHDPELAKQWIGRMPTAQTQAFATRAVASGLARIDPEEALAWSQTLNGDMRDESLAGVVSGFSDNPQRQYDIAQTIQDETIKSAALRIAIFSMGGRDVARATQWLESSSFDDFQREELRRYLEQQ